MSSVHDKKIYTKSEFEDLNLKAARNMSADAELHRDALNVLVNADKYRWIHQSTWLGEPILNLPQDMFAIQEIIWRTKPDYVIEVGVAWGGGMLFEAMLLDLIGGEKVVGVDIFIPDDLRQRLGSHSRLSGRMELIEGDSTSSETLKKINDITGGSKNLLVILDSNHTHQHVLKELRTYGPMVAKGYYLVCGDTIIEDMPHQAHGERPWGRGNSPATAVKQFLLEDSRYTIDANIESKLLFSCHPRGYLLAKS